MKVARVLALKSPDGLIPEVRVHPAALEVHVPSPAAAAKPFEGPRIWHTAHRNNLARMLDAAGWAEVAYELHGGGEGATILYESLDPAAVPGKLPEPVQTYLEEHFGSDCFDLFRLLMGAVKLALPLISTLFPKAGPAVHMWVAGVSGDTVIDTVGEAVDELDDE